MEAGIRGEVLEKELAKHGLCSGHEPVRLINNSYRIQWSFQLLEDGYRLEQVE